MAVLGVTLGVALLVMGVYLFLSGLNVALRTFSRSQLELLAQSRGHAGRVERVVQYDEPLERATGAWANLAALGLSFLLAVLVYELSGMGRFIWLAVSAGGVGAVLVARVAVGLLSRVHAEGLLYDCAPILDVVKGVSRPLLGILQGMERLVYRRWRLDADGPRPTSVEVEIPFQGEDGDEEEGELSLQTRSLIERAIELDRQDVGDVMTPRNSMISLAAASGRDEATRVFIESGFSRLPLYGENRDDLIGILYAKEFFARCTELPPGEDVDLRELARAALYVPETKNASELLNELRLSQGHMAIVLNEYGTVAGLVTLEDLLEELVGDIQDELDEEENTELIVAMGDEVYEVEASLELEELNRRLGLRYPTDDDFSTVGGLVFCALGHLPEPGASFQRDGVRFTVLSVEGRSIRRIEIDLTRGEVSARPAGKGESSTG